MLQEHGIAINDIQKLQNAGYHTVESVRSTPFSSTTMLYFRCCWIFFPAPLTPFLLSLRPPFRSIELHFILIASRLSSHFLLTFQVAHATVRRLSDVKGISEAKVTKLKEIVKQMVVMEFQTAADALETRKNIVHLTTGSVEIDKLLEGGIETGSITEVVSHSPTQSKTKLGVPRFSIPLWSFAIYHSFAVGRVALPCPALPSCRVLRCVMSSCACFVLNQFGEFRTGKTQLCHTLCVTCQMSCGEGGAEGKAIYIDTEGSFRPERLEKIAERFGLDPAVALENVACARAHNSEHQMELLKVAAAIMAQVSLVCPTRINNQSATVRTTQHNTTQHNTSLQISTDICFLYGPYYSCNSFSLPFLAPLINESNRHPSLLSWSRTDTPCWWWILPRHCTGRITRVAESSPNDRCKWDSSSASSLDWPKNLG